MSDQFPHRANEVTTEAHAAQPQQDLSSLEFYSHGATPFFALQADQRFSYCMYVPLPRAGDPERLPLIVLQHGTGRTAELYRDGFAEFAEEHRVAILAPLFPVGIGDPWDLHNFKFIEYEGIRFDLLLLEMISEAALRASIETSQFYLQGFSGGGQFVHRFLYLHPERLKAISIGAPGRFTLLDDSQPWWLGTQDLETQFGRPVDIEAISNVAIQLVVGELDVDEWEINNTGDSNWTPGLEAQGRTRVERMRYFQKNLESHNIQSELTLAPNVAHDGAKILDHVKLFFARQLQ